jgi:hypothetical protein
LEFFGKIHEPHKNVGNPFVSLAKQNIPATFDLVAGDEVECRVIFDQLTQRRNAGF